VANSYQRRKKKQLSIHLPVTIMTDTCRSHSSSHIDCCEVLVICTHITQTVHCIIGDNEKLEQNVLVQKCDTRNKSGYPYSVLSQRYFFKKCSEYGNLNYITDQLIMQKK
jgi:hypothetical protein